MPPKMRRCQRCEKNRNVKFFTPRGRICASCRRESARRTAKDGHLQNTYGITHNDYDTMLKVQDGRCAICRGDRKGKFDVDHDHRVEKQMIGEGTDPITARSASIRGLLCKRCNRRLLPASLDSVEILQNAIHYLLDPPAYHVLWEVWD